MCNIPNVKKITGCNEHIELSRYAATEGMVLLKNEGPMLPFSAGSKIALFGKGAVAYVKGGGGSGDVYCEYVRNIYSGFGEKEKEGKIFVNSAVAEFYDSYLKEAEASGGVMVGTDTVAEPVLPDGLVAAAAEESDVAVVVISRFSKEGTDRLAEGDYYLTDEEKLLVDKVSAAFEKTVLVLNVGAVVDSSYFADNDSIPAVLLAWQAGMEGGLAVADVLCGDVNPSGKLVDTFAKSLDDYPSTASLFDSDVYVEYYDDIYVGYRYFETIPGAKDKVNYPFGHGLSYTEFELKCIKAFERDGEIKVSLKVRNIGKRAGKQVVQLYFSAPCGLLGKPARQLGAFAKTKELFPDEEQDILLSFSVNDMASYDDLGKIQKSAYLLEKGEYCFYVGTSVRDTVKTDYVYTVEQDRVTKQLTQRCTPCNLTRRMLWDGSYEPLPQKEVEFNYVPATKLCKGKEGVIPCFDDLRGDTTVEELVAAFTDYELCDFLGGSPNVGVSNTSCFSGLERLGIPPLPTADGPAGLRLDAHHCIATTAWPCATLLACTWNEELVEKIGACGGAELKENGLYAWLTPALNIHRTPLCGRNFEYFSEDPLIAGKMAAAKVKGIQSVGVACSIKHFAANNLELNRIKSDSRVSERALREIYLKGFEICVKQADPWTVMTSYNLLNGIHTAESYDLVTVILREEWGFSGMVTTDWGIKNNQIREVKAGNDMKMHIGYPDELAAALKTGELTRAELEACACRILKVYKRVFIDR